MTSTVALATTAPVLSVIVPRMVPAVPPWPNRRTAGRTSSRNNANLRVVLDMSSSGQRFKGLIGCRYSVVADPHRYQFRLWHSAAPQGLARAGESHWRLSIVNPQVRNRTRFAVRNKLLTPREIRQRPYLTALSHRRCGETGRYRHCEKRN